MQLAYVLMWTVPFDKADENTSARSLYAFFTVCFYNVISSCYHVPYLALTMELSDDEAQRFRPPQRPTPVGGSAFMIE